MKFLKLSAVTTALIAATSASAVTNVNTNIEMNNLWVTDLGLSQQGRVEVNLDSQQGKGMFVSAKASLMADRNGDISTDDMWVQLGNNSMNIKLGRFQALNLFPLGQGAAFIENTYLPKANGAKGYQANILRGRTGWENNTNTMGWSKFHSTVGFNTGTAATGALAVEVGVVDTKTGTGTDNVKGVRPVVTGNFGMFKVSAGAEIIKQNAQSYTGFGITAGFKTSADALYNINFASTSDNGVRSSSVGFNGDFGPLGLGVVLDKTTRQSTTSTFYGSYTMPLFGIQGASIVPALSYSKADGANSVTGANVRINYAF